MRKLRIFEHMSLDGVIQSSGEDDFPYANWTTSYRSPAGLAMLTEMYGDSYDLLLGRRTYDMWSAFWPRSGTGPMAERLNAATKFVVTHRPDSLEWGPAQAVTELVDGVGRVKATDGPDLIVCGSSTITSALIEYGLADEVNLIVYPVLVGTGKRFFAEGTPARAFTLDSMHPFPTGPVLHRYTAPAPLPQG